MKHSFNAAGIVFFLALIFSPSVQAESFRGYVNTAFDMRAGPSTSYPTIVHLQSSLPVDIVGCLRDMTWCDVAWNNYRGWVDGRYLDSVFNNRRVRVPDYCVQADLPIVGFDQQSYWDAYYTHFSFYRSQPQ